MDFSEYKKAKIGIVQLEKLSNHLMTMGWKGLLIYDFSTHELIITDEKLIRCLNLLEIHYDLREPPNAVKFVSGLE